MAKDAAIILLAALTLFALLSWASAPNAVAIQEARATAAEQKVVALQTQIARYPTPTAVPCRAYQYMQYGC